VKKTFKGGAHPPENKEYSNSKPIEDLPLPDRVVIPLIQHLGAPSKPVVSIGDEVKTGDPVSEATGFVSVPSHSSISGKVISIGAFPHPFGKDIQSVVIESDGEDRWNEKIKFDEKYMDIPVKEMIEKIQNAGLAGMGGAAFPTHVKLSPPPPKKIEIAILNGAECEPYLTSDHRLMLEKTEDIIKGFKLIMKILDAKYGYIGIENNKPDAIDKMRSITSNEKNIEVVGLNVKYPQGAEKQLIKALTNREVPSGGLPMDVQCLVQNVGTALAVYEALAYNKPLVERVVTVTGSGIKEPKNLRVRIGTLFKNLVDYCGGYTVEKGKLIMGGPMMGLAQYTDLIPVIKGSSGFVVMTEEESFLEEPKPCILCGRCVDTCPMKLLPCTLGTLVEYSKFEMLGEYNILDCIECGSCAFVCPSKRNLVHLIKYGKLKYNEIRKKSA